MQVARLPKCRNSRSAPTQVVYGLGDPLDIPSLEEPVQRSNNLLKFLVCLGNRRIERLHILLDRGAGGAAPAVDGGSDTAIVASLKVPELADCALCLGPEGSSLGGVEFDGGSLVERGIRHGYGTSGQCGGENGEKTGNLHSEIRFFWGGGGGANIDVNVLEWFEVARASLSRVKMEEKDIVELTSLNTRLSANK